MYTILAIPRLFKHVTFKTAICILQNKTLQWSIPDSFNDPFEFKSPFEYAFEWDDMSEIALREFAKILTQAEEPDLLEGNPVAAKIKERRRECKGKDPNEVLELVRPKFRLLVQKNSPVFISGVECRRKIAKA